jgi:signal transduction histidine kinase
MVQAQESLRRDIAQQLHGTVQNRMIVVANRLVELADAGASETELSELSKIVIALIDDDLRPMSHQLYPSILRRGLVPAVQTVAESVEPAKALTLEIDERLQRSERSDRNYIPYDIRLGCYRVAEEAVTNLLKHSAASEVHITLARESNLLTLWVEDNGRGFDTAASANSIGLAVMRDFAEVNGGSCTVTSRPGDGTRVSARFPLPRPAK